MSEPIRLTEWTSCGGCAAKWGAIVLAGLVKELPAFTQPGLLIGTVPFDDAAVFRLTDDLALVSTTDFFPPLVDARPTSGVWRLGGAPVWLREK